MTDMGPPEDWGVLSPDEDQRVCSQYDGCDITLHGYMFSPIGYRIPFN